MHRVMAALRLAVRLTALLSLCLVGCGDDRASTNPFARRRGARQHQAPSWLRNQDPPLRLSNPVWTGLLQVVGIASWGGIPPPSL